MKRSQNVLITGASSGFGLSLARRLSADGYRVFGTSRRRQTPIDGVTLLQLDVTSDDSVRSCVEEVLRSAGAIDVLVNNAGRLDEGPLEEFSAAELQTVFDTNVFGVARMVNAVLPSMRARRGGRIINVSSLSGLMPVPFMGPYCASKYALEGYTESLRYEVRPLGIHVSLVEPGYFRTGLADRKFRKSGIADYEPDRRRVFAAIDRDEQVAPPPDAVITRLMHIIESPRPRLRYPLGKYTLNYLLRGVTPEWIWEFGTRKTFGLA